MTRSEQELLRALETNVDSFDSYFEDEDADAPVITKMPTKMAKVKGNPAFSAQFDITTYLKFFTLNGGSYTAIAASALNAALKNSLPLFLFGFNDYLSGFYNLQKLYPVNSNWTIGRPGIYGKDFFDGAFDSTVTALLIKGDLVIPFTSALPGAGTTTLALVIVRCPQVAYGTLLQSLASDRFVQNMIRYTVPDETATSLAQYQNNIGIHKLSLFGKNNNDFVSPNSYNKPEDQKKNIIDVPLKTPIDKQKALATYINYDVSYITWSTYVWTVRKLA